MSKTKEVVAFDFSKNKKQCVFYDTVMNAVAKENEYRHFFYGGGIRGGKTFVCLYIFWKLAEWFPNSIWVVIRQDNQDLIDTTIPSMEKLIGKAGKNFRWKKPAGNVHVQFDNGSKIFFKSENIIHDPELGWMLGFECNGIFLEQLETLSEKTHDMAVQRIGSWYIESMPIPVLLSTFNPTPLWPKRQLYDKFIKGELKENQFYCEALPQDNLFVTEEQYKNWNNLDDQSYNQMIKGIWVFAGDGNLFAYCFNYLKHVVDTNTPEGFKFMALQKELPVFLIFDFNVDPITCLVAQKSGLDWGKICFEYRIRNSNIYELTERIATDLKGFFLIATGDASGRNQSALTKGNLTFTEVIKTELSLSPTQIQFPTVNPSVRMTRMVVNSVLQKHPRFFIASRCQFLIDDLQTIKTDEKGEINEKQKKKEKLKTHLLDNLRYFSWNYFKKFVNIN